MAPILFGDLLRVSLGIFCLAKQKKRVQQVGRSKFEDPDFDDFGG